MNNFELQQLLNLMKPLWFPPTLLKTLRGVAVASDEARPCFYVDFSHPATHSLPPAPPLRWESAVEPELQHPGRMTFVLRNLTWPAPTGFSVCMWLRLTDSLLQDGLGDDTEFPLDASTDAMGAPLSLFTLESIHEPSKRTSAGADAAPLSAVSPPSHLQNPPQSTVEGAPPPLPVSSAASSASLPSSAPPPARALSPGPAPMSTSGPSSFISAEIAPKTGLLQIRLHSVDRSRQRSRHKITFASHCFRPGRWYHVALVHKPVTSRIMRPRQEGTVALYVDGLRRGAEEALAYPLGM